MLNPPDMRVVYATQMRTHVHELIAMGYNLMDNTPSFANSEEPAITGELIRSMKELLESENAPKWAIYYSISDDPPMNVNGKYGKDRPRVDLEFERTGIRGSRPRFRFEAKRLGTTSGHTVAAYLGENGLGCFISGKYPINNAEGGMLGYIQNGSEESWSDRIERALNNKDKNKYDAIDPPYQHQQVCSLKYTYISHHYSKALSRVIIIHHVLLRFY